MFSLFPHRLIAMTGAVHECEERVTIGAMVFEARRTVEIAANRVQLRLNVGTVV
jgi:hypothetical protein